MVKMLGVVLVALISFLPGISFAQSALTGWYLAPQISYNYVKTEQGNNDASDAVLGFGLAGGYNFKPRFDFPMRAELEFFKNSVVENELSITDGFDTYKLKEEMDIITVFANLYVDFYTGTRVTPYVGAGVGAAHYEYELKFAGQKYSVENWRPAFNAGAGLAFHLSKNVAVDLGYRYIYTNGDNDIKSWSTHRGTLGIRVSF